MTDINDPIYAPGIAKLTEDGFLPTHSVAASTQSSAEKITELIDHVVNRKLEETAKTVADMLDFANVARQHAAQMLREHNACSEPAWNTHEWHEKDRDLVDRYEIIDERVSMLQRKLKMIQAAQAFMGEGE